jgi:tRNA pseudouridine55 synthase
MALDGLLLVNKPTGPTSYDVIRVVKRQVKGTKIGHCGTLDPIASGLLILLFGKFTKKQSIYMGQDKIYRAQIKFGLKTDSGDITGKKVADAPVPSLTPEALEKAFSVLVGERDQCPPMFSAVKVGGKPLYKLARKGEVVERKPRRIRIDRIELLNVIAPDSIEVRVRCSSGTYIRTLAEEIGEKMDSVATMSALVREQIGDFSIGNAVPGEDLFRLDETMLQERVCRPS